MNGLNNGDVPFFSKKVTFIGVEASEYTRALGKYEKLGGHLGSSGNEQIKLTFGEIENILGFRLPRSAFKHRPWWANDDSHVQAMDGWIRSGYNTESVSLDNGVVTFVKVKKN